MSNFSRQKAIIVKVLEQNPHASVAQIHAIAQKLLPNLSLATTYRNIERLEQEGLLQKLQLNKNTTLFELADQPHHHFICQKCQSIQHITEPGTLTCLSCVNQKQNLSIEFISFTAFGTCANCQNQ